MCCMRFAFSEYWYLPLTEILGRKMQPENLQLASCQLGNTGWL